MRFFSALHAQLCVYLEHLLQSQYSYIITEWIFFFQTTWVITFIVDLFLMVSTCYSSFVCPALSFGCRACSKAWFVEHNVFPRLKDEEGSTTEYKKTALFSCALNSNECKTVWPLHNSRLGYLNFAGRPTPTSHLKCVATWFPKSLKTNCKAFHLGPAYDTTFKSSHWVCKKKTQV